MVLLIDNYDSFTYNLVQRLGEQNTEWTVRVVRNDAITLEEIEALSPKKIIISPGPCTPNEAGISVELVRRFAGEIPILGVCLGHQSIAQAYGGKIVRADRLMHGKTSAIFHDGQGSYSGLPNPFTATRYHSLVVDRNTLPAEFEVSAWTDQDEMMGIRHKELPLEGLQFHPESFLTEHGPQLLRNFMAERWPNRH